VFHYTYITTNLINGKKYIGNHSTDNLKDNYLGSGKPIFLNALKKYGENNFKKEILEFFDTKQEAFNAQKKYINEYNTLIPNGYNISPSGGMKGTGGLHSEESKEKIRKNSIGKNLGKKHSQKQNIEHSKFLMGKILSEDHKKKISESNKGKKHSEETREKIGKANKGKKRSLDVIENHSKKISGVNHPFFNKSLSKEHRKKISESNKGKIISSETRQKMSESAKNRNKKK